ncbi:MAG: hypothetical protein ACQEXB_07290 [Bacillota bacterium]
MTDEGNKVQNSIPYSIWNTRTNQKQTKKVMESQQTSRTQRRDAADTETGR